ncbi:MAG: cupin domain-containing protein [Zoogloea sp.]|nr:cupin domain-containing protein [Zoogloea sp.]
MTSPLRPLALTAAEMPPRCTPSSYPPEFVQRLAGRVKRPLGDAFGLRNFGVNLTRLPPGARSALRHAHLTQDEFIYVLEGCPALVTDAGTTRLAPGMCAGFPAGENSSVR